MSDDYRQSDAYQKQAILRGEQVISLGKEVGYSLRLLIILKTIVAPRVKDQSILELIEEEVIKNRPALLIVAPKVEFGEPEADSWQQAFALYGYKSAPFGVAPTKTLEVSISESEDEILAQMASRTRYNIRLAERRGVSVGIYSGTEELANPGLFKEFYSTYHENCRRVKIPSESEKNLKHLLEAFQEDAIVIHAYFENEICAVASLVVAGDTITYYVNGSTEIGRKNFAPNLVIWEGMRTGKNKGCEWFDFDGIFDERYSGQKDWEGFTRFKKGFGGVERQYIGSYSKWWPTLKRRKTAKKTMEMQSRSS